MRKSHKRGMGFVGLGLLLVAAVSVSGCQPLKKKFTRKKKEVKKDEFVPVLTPIEYASPHHTVEESYAHYYNLWKVWNKEVLDAVFEDASDKRQKYLLAQLIGQLNEMGFLLTGEKQEALYGVLAKYKHIREQFNKPRQLRRYSLIQKDLEMLAKTIRLDLDLQAVEGFLEEPADK